MFIDKQVMSINILSVNYTYHVVSRNTSLAPATHPMTCGKVSFMQDVMDEP